MSDQSGDNRIELYPFKETVEVQKIVFGFLSLFFYYFLPCVLETMIGGL